jgi:hypothetical protein
MGLVQEIGAFAGLCAILGLAVLAALYMSQARELRRVRERLDESSGSDQPHAPGGPASSANDASSARRTDYVAQPAVVPTEQAHAEAAQQVSDTEKRLDETQVLTSGRKQVQVLGVLLRIAGVAVFSGVIALAVMQAFGTSKKPPAPRPTAAVAATPMPAQGVRVAVLNASSTPGLGERMIMQAQGTGISIIRVDDVQRRATSVVMYRPGAQAAAGEVSKRLGIARMAPVDARTSSFGSDAAVIALIGSDKKGS